MIMNPLETDILTDKKIKQRILSSESPYSDLNTEELIADALSKIDTSKKLLIKKIPLLQVNKW